MPTQYFLLQLQLINHFFWNSLTNEKGVSNKKSVTMHSSIITDFRAFHLFQKFVCSLLTALFRTFLQSLLNRVLFLTFEQPKRTFFGSESCRIYQQKLADREKFSFIMLCWGNSWNFFMLSTMLSSTVCFSNEEIVAPWRFKNLDKKDCIVCVYTISPGWRKRRSLRLSAVL